MKIIFMGTPDFSVPTLERIYKDGHEIQCVFTQMDKERSRGKKVSYTPVKQKAIDLGIDVVQPYKLKNNLEIYELILNMKPDIIVVVAYGQILPKEILEIPKHGCVNVHASLLPKLRGASPIQHSILTGETNTGVTIMLMGEGLDTGDMIKKGEIEIHNKNAKDLHDELSYLGADLLSQTLNLIEQKKATFEKQDETKVTYAGIITKEDGKINFDKSPVEVERHIRAFDPWPGAYCTYEDVVMKFWGAKPLEREATQSNGTIVEVDKTSFKVVCGGKLLEVTEIQMPSKKRVRVEEYLKGNSIKVNTVLV